MGIFTLLKRTAASVATPGAGKSSFFIDSADGIPTVKDDAGAIAKLGGLPSTRQVIAGAGLTGGGDLSANRTLDVVAADGTIIVDADSIRANVGTGAGSVAAGNDSRITGAVPGTRALVAGAGLTGGGALSADRTVDVGAAADGSIVVSADAVGVGVLATDAQHGNRGGGALHAAATQAVPGFMPVIDKVYLDGHRSMMVHVTDYGADKTGVADSRAAILAAIAALPNGGIVYFPAGQYLISAAIPINTAHIRLIGASRYATSVMHTYTSGDMFDVGEWFQTFEDMRFVGPGTGQVPTKTSGWAIDASGGAYTKVRRCSFEYQYDCVNLSNTLAELEEAECRYFKHSGVVVNHNSDHQIDGLTCDNNAGALPTGCGIDIQNAASCLLSNCNVIHSNWALNISPAAGVTVPSVKGVNCFFDTSAVGLNMVGAGAVLRSQFTNCWFSSMTQAGIYMAPAAGGQVDGLSFLNCDVYNNVGGTTRGIHVASTLVGRWSFIGGRIAGWTAGIELTAGANHFPQIISANIGAVSAFGQNGTGIIVGAGTYKGLVIQTNDVTENGTALTLGAVTLPAGTYNRFRIIDNAGINPRGAVTPPIAAPVTATTYTNMTGFRCNVLIRGATMTAGPTVNGVVPPAGAGVANQWLSVMLDPGATIAVAGTTLIWAWSAL